MYGIHCDMCGRFAQEKDCDKWGRIQTLTTAYDGYPTVDGKSGLTRHVCPVCLSMLMEKFIN